MTKDNADYGLYVHYVRSAIPKCHGYQELHAHSEASFRDAVNKVDDFVETAKGYGRQAFDFTCPILSAPWSGQILFDIFELHIDVHKNPPVILHRKYRQGVLE